MSRPKVLIEIKRFSDLSRFIKIYQDLSRFIKIYQDLSTFKKGLALSNIIFEMFFLSDLNVPTKGALLPVRVQADLVFAVHVSFL
jgi:hypothetical protein